MKTPPIEPLAKPSGVTLRDHTCNVRRLAAAHLKARPFVARKYLARISADLGERLDLAARWHDVGKCHPKWQDACVLQYLEGGDHLLHAGIRHEMASLDFAQRRKQDLPGPVRAAIAAHHKKLGERHEKRWHDDPAFPALWNEFKALSHFAPSYLPDFWGQVLCQRYEYDGPRALLQLADHFASAQEDGEELPELKPFDYSFPTEWTRRGFQRKEILAQFWNEPFAILRAPTGAGKTDTALLWAQHQIAQDRADRLIIAMPTRFTANALSIATTSTLSQTGLYHSSALLHRIGQSEEGYTKLLGKEQELARNLETPVTVTTLDHLCICLTGVREEHHATFWSLAHACIVIDEADFYDAWTQSSLLVLLRALRLLECPVLLMSATVPESARRFYAQAFPDVPTIFEDKSDLERVRCYIHKGGAVSQPSDISHLLQRALPDEDGNEGEPLIIYANTVSRAQEYLDWFEERKFQNVVLYHSRFIEEHKLEKEEELRAMLGPQAWKDETAHGVAILTQIGEMSVNISANLMISDICPLDRLAQRAGRLARFTHELGELWVVEPKRKNKRSGELEFYPAPYGDYIVGLGWQMTPALESSLHLLREGKYSAKTFVDLVNELYPVAPNELPDARVNREALEKCFTGNWLILPGEEKKETIEGGEDERTKDWKCRDIPTQITVWADYKPSSFIDYEKESGHFQSWLKFAQARQQHGIAIHVYEFKSAEANGLIEEIKVTIGDERADVETVFCARANCYSHERGLRFDESVTEVE